MQRHEKRKAKRERKKGGAAGKIASANDARRPHYVCMVGAA